MRQSGDFTSRDRRPLQLSLKFKFSRMRVFIRLISPRSTFRFSALSMPMGSIVVGPSSSTARSRHRSRGTPLLEIVPGLGKLLEILGSVFEGDERAAAEQRYRIIQRSLPARRHLRGIFHGDCEINLTNGARRLSLLECPWTRSPSLSERMARNSRGSRLVRDICFRGYARGTGPAVPIAFEIIAP